MELTTEGGLDVIAHQARITDLSSALGEAGIIVSLFIEADEKTVAAAAEARRCGSGAAYRYVRGD